MKSIYAYEFTKVYGPLGYLDTANFSNQAKHEEIIEKANQYLLRNNYCRVSGWPTKPT